jgi:Ca-activated chloride channel homolog
MSGLTLLAPIGLFALIGLPLVLLFHMRNPVPVSRDVPSLRFWRMAMRAESHSEQFRRPPISLLLLLHLLLIALIALALARPAASRTFGAFGDRFEPDHLVVLLDGSTSMSATPDPASPETRFDRARKDVLNRLASVRDGDVVTLIVMGARISTYEATDSAGLATLRAIVRGLAPPGGRADLNSALSLSTNLMLPGMSDRIVVISDGALVVDPALAARAGAPIDYVDLSGGTTGNVAIVDLSTRASVANPGEQSLYLRLVNFGELPVTAPLVITVDGIELARSDVTLSPGGMGEEIIQSLPAGAAVVSASIEIIDSLPADNVASSVLADQTQSGLRVLLVSDSPSALFRALSVLPGAQVTLAAPLAAPQATAARFDLVVYEHADPGYEALDAPVLLVNPPGDGLLAANGVMANPTVVRVRAQDPTLAGVELAGVTFGQTPVFQLDPGSSEIVGAEAGPLLFRGSSPTSGQPMIVVAFDVAQSNVTQRPAFPILIANIVGELVPSLLPPAVPLGETLTYRPRARAASIVVTPPGDKPVSFHLTTAIDANGQQASQEFTFSETGQPGDYRVTELDMDGVTVRTGTFVVNAGHYIESNLTPNRDLPGILGTATATEETTSASSLSDFWPLLLVAALVILLAEWIATLVRPSRRRRGRPFRLPV